MEALRRGLLGRACLISWCAVTLLIYWQVTQPWPVVEEPHSAMPMVNQAVLKEESPPQEEKVVVPTEPPAVLSLTTAFSIEDRSQDCAPIFCGEEAGAQHAVDGHHTTIPRSCANCLGGGRSGWPLSVHPSMRGSRLFWVENILYDKGEPWISGASVRNFTQCYAQCEVTWFEHTGNPLQNARQLQGTEAPKTLDCIANQPWTWNSTALVVSNYAVFTLYHFIIDNVFLAWVTLAQMAQVFGCPRQDIPVFTVTEHNMPFEWITQFHPIWPLLFAGSVQATPQHVSKMHGCFKTIVYGYLYNQKMLHHLTTHMGWYRDPILATWFTAFSTNVRNVWLPKLPQSLEAPGSLLFWRHKQRMPQYMLDFDWNAISWYNSTLAKGRLHVPVFKNVEDWTPVHGQVRLVSSARGLISIEGSAFALALFLPPRSLLFIVNIPLKEKSRTCNRLPETWHETTALHLGHSAVNWRFCGSAEAFGPRAAGVMELFLNLGEEAAVKDEAFACVVLRDAWQGPRCYKKISMPLAGALPSCGAVGKVGRPFSRDTTWHYISSKGVFEHTNGRGVWSL